MAQGQMGNLHEAVFMRFDEKIDIAAFAQVVLLGKTGKCHHLAVVCARGFYGVQDIR